MPRIVAAQENAPPVAFAGAGGHAAPRKAAFPMQSAGYTLLIIGVVIKLAIIAVAGLVILMGASALRRPAARSKIGGTLLILFAVAFGGMQVAGLFRLLSAARWPP
jgi:hypothetical protein